MKHALRKYISPCGSALFMVVSTMAALIVLVTAMYMSVLSSRQVQYATFDQEQAYVSSTSIADIIGAYMADTYSSIPPVVSKILSLKEGESISTTSDGIKFLDNTGVEELLGRSGDITIQRLKNETVSGTEWYIYDVAVTVTSNGITETTHTYFRSKPGEPGKMEAIDRFFTNTGYLPNDVWISSVTTDSKLYCDNEYTIFSKDINTDRFGGGGDVIINMDITCAGAAIFDASCTIKDIKAPLIWNIGNNFTIGNNCTVGTFDLGGTSSEHAKIVVGGDLILYGNRTFSAYTDVYVLGNVYIYGYEAFKGNLYVGKDVIFAEKDRWSSFDNLYIDGTIRALEGFNVATSSSAKGSWGDSFTWSTFLDNEIGGSVYPKWTVNTSSFGVENITFNTDDDSLKENAKYIHYINSDCTIGNVKDAYAGNGTTPNLTIVIDTGDDPNGIRTLSVQANCDDVGYDNTFMWYPEASPSGGKVINILTVGCGTLVIDVPEGVTYQAADQEFFGHISWFMMGGGEINKTMNGAPYFSRGSMDLANYADIISDNNLILQAPDGTCDYETIESGGKVVGYTCKSHGGSCDEADVKEFEAGKKDTLCIGRILKDKVDDFWASNSAKLDEVEEYYTKYFGSTRSGSSGYDTRCYYPNVDIFVVSSLENADIQFGVKKADMSNIQNNVYFGYVYAPYMTYISVGSGGGLKTVGGLVVSDMAVNGSYKFIFAQPSRTIQQIVGDNFEALKPSGNRSWRIHGV